MAECNTMRILRSLKQAVSLYQTGIASSRSLPGDLTRGDGFQYLPGTLREVEAVKKQAGNTSGSVTVLSGVNATEESVKALNGKASPSVLHIATHGFFFPDPKDDKRDSLQQKSESRVVKPLSNPIILYSDQGFFLQAPIMPGRESPLKVSRTVSLLLMKYPICTCPIQN